MPYWGVHPRLGCRMQNCRISQYKSFKKWGVSWKKCHPKVKTKIPADYNQDLPMSTMMSTIVYHVDWDLDPLCPQPRLAKVAARRPRAAENALGRTGGWAGSNLTGGFSGGHPNWMGCCWGAYEPLFEIQFLEIPLFSSLYQEIPRTMF